MTIAVAGLRCESLEDPLGIDAERPRLGWRLESDRRGTRQAGYRIKATRESPDFGAEAGLLWDSGDVASDACTHVPYGGPELRSGERVWWRVRATDCFGRESGWSAPAHWEMGLLAADDWRGRWIAPDFETKETDNPCPLLRKEFELEVPIRSARAYVTAHGLYEVQINGRRVGDLRLTPGFTSFGERLQYQVFDVGELLHPGRNAVGVTLADGWWRSHLWFRMRPNVFGSELALLAELRVEHADGGSTTVASDASWRASTGAIRSSDLSFGEVVDARMEQVGWCEPGFREDGRWTGVRVVEADYERLCCSPSPPVRVVEEREPRRILRSPDGAQVLDFGQVLAGTVRLELAGPAGTEVVLGHCEELSPEGDLPVDQYDNLGVQKRQGRFIQVDRYVLKGEGEETFEPRFTYHGFRYVRVTGYASALTPETVRARVLQTDLAEVGDFDCSDERVNQLHRNILWSQKGNFIDVPTDCPQREKMGWTGDIQIYAPTAFHLMDAVGLTTKWLLDLKCDQFEDGRIPHVVPWLPDYPVFPRLGSGGSAAWGDACTVVPWTQHVFTGDRRILELLYPVMQRWLAHIETRSRGDLWIRGMHWGDWLEPGREEWQYFLPGARKAYVATPYWVNSLVLAAATAERLGLGDEAAAHRARAERVKQAYRRRFVRGDGRLKPHRQGAYVLALAFDMLEGPAAQKAADWLARLVRENGNRLDTGFASTVHLCPVLCRHGHSDLAFALLEQEAAPSWLYQVKHGATTIWEKWDAKRPDGRLRKGCSFNHYAFGAIGAWLYEYVAGIRPDAEEPGFRHVLLEPHPGGGLTAARARHRSALGTNAVAWRQDGDRMSVEVAVPPNARATLRLPGADASEVCEAGLALADAEGVGAVREEAGDTLVEIGSGEYHFEYPWGGRVGDAGA
jgi:alpha-L-rhamnosidase